MLRKLVGESIISGEYCNQVAASEITDLSETTVWRERQHLGGEKINGHLWYKTNDCLHYEQVSGELVLTCGEIARNRSVSARQARRWAEKDYVPTIRQNGESKGYKASEWIKPYNEWLLKIELI